MKIILETHKYAPELNKAHINGTTLEAKGIFSIKDFRAKHFMQVKKGRYVSISFSHIEECHKWLDKTYQGYVSSYKDIIKFIKEMKVKHNLPNTVKIKSKYIG